MFEVEHDDLIKRIKALKTIPTPFYAYVHWHGGENERIW